MGYITHIENVRECVTFVSESEKAKTVMTEAAFSFHPHSVGVELAIYFIDTLCLIGLFSYSAGITLRAGLTTIGFSFAGPVFRRYLLNG